MYIYICSLLCYANPHLADIYIHICICLCVCVCIYLFITLWLKHIYISACVFLYVNLHYVVIGNHPVIDSCIYVYMYICMYVYMYVCIQVYMYSLRCDSQPRLSDIYMCVWVCVCVRIFTIFRVWFLCIRPTLRIISQYLRAFPADLPSGSWYLTKTKCCQLYKIFPPDHIGQVEINNSTVLRNKPILRGGSDPGSLKPRNKIWILCTEG